MPGQGRVPERSDQRRRRNKTEIEITSADSSGYTADWGSPDPEWHPLMAEAYLAIQASPQSVYCTQADIAQARITCHVWSIQLARKEGPTSQAMGSLFGALDSLLMTEGARRRLRIEVAKLEKTEEAEVFDIEARRRNLASGG